MNVGWGSMFYFYMRNVASLSHRAFAPSSHLWMILCSVGTPWTHDNLEIPLVKWCLDVCAYSGIYFPMNWRQSADFTCQMTFGCLGFFSHLFPLGTVELFPAGQYQEYLIQSILWGYINRRREMTFVLRLVLSYITDFKKAFDIRLVLLHWREILRFNCLLRIFCVIYD